MPFADQPTRPLTEDARHDFKAMEAALTDRTRVVLICTPNNPTGPVVRRDELLAFLDVVPRDVIVVLDEAYREFIREPEALFWALLFPIALAAGLGIAFRNRPPEILKIAAVTPRIAPRRASVNTSWSQG